MTQPDARLQTILQQLDHHLHRNDYTAAEQFLKAQLTTAKQQNDTAAMVLIYNEQMGLYRKQGQQENALCALHAVLELIEEKGLSAEAGAATTFLNAATVYKAFGEAALSLPLFEQAEKIYSQTLAPNDKRFAGLYNNMGLTLVDLQQFARADALYQKAINLLRQYPDADLEIAITYLNMASAAEAELGIAQANQIINAYLDKATHILEHHANQDGYYAFVCEKCASVFGYYGHFIYEKELLQRPRRIYEGA